MSTFKVRNKETGEIFTIREKDNSKISFLDKGSQIKESPVNDFLPRKKEVDSLINEREDLLGKFLTGFKPKDILNTVNPLARAQTGMKGLDLIGGLGQRVESALTNPALEAQSGNFNPKGLLNSMFKGATGEDKSQLGDLVRTTGFGGIINEPLASSAGFFATIGVMNLATKGKLLEGGNKIKSSIQKVRQISKDNKRFFFKERAEMLSEGADDVITSMRHEFDDLYGRIGGNTVGPEDQAIIQEAVDKIPAATFKRFAKLEKLDLKADKLPADLNTIKKLKGVIGRTVPKKVWSGIDDATPEQSQLINTYHDINDIIANNAGSDALRSELLALNKKYKEGLGFRNIINKFTKTQSTGVTKTSIRNIRSSSNQGTLAELESFADKFYPKTIEILRDIDKFNRFQGIKKGVNTALKFGIGVEAGRRFVARPLLDKISGRQ